MNEKGQKVLKSPVKTQNNENKKEKREENKKIIRKEKKYKYK